jgi:outer membrane protein OmpA-like peptidoglycan-associated protein
MFDDNDPETGFAVGFAVAAAIFVALFAVGVALVITSSARQPTATAATAGPLAPIRVYFEAGQDRMPDEAAARLASLVAVAMADSGKRIVISGYHERSGDAGFGAEVARQRAYAVRDFFRASGIAEERIVLEEPREAAAGSEDREARRVEVMLQ